MYKLPRPHLSISQINLWESDPSAYMKRYFLNIPDEPSPMMEFGKQFTFRHLAICLSFQAANLSSVAIKCKETFNQSNKTSPNPEVCKCLM